MTAPSPYAPTSAGTVAPSSQRIMTTRSLWWGYAVAPIIPPILISLIVIASGILFSDPNATGTPIGIIVAPIMIMTFGAAFSYLIASVVAMPIIYVLNRRGTLNRYTVHLGAAGISLALTTFVIAIGVATEESISIQELATTTGFTFVVLMIIWFPGSLVFWWVARRMSQRVAVVTEAGFGNSVEAPQMDNTVPPISTE